MNINLKLNNLVNPYTTEATLSFQLELLDSANNVLHIGSSTNATITATSGSLLEGDAPVIGLSLTKVLEQADLTLSL